MVVQCMCECTSVSLSGVHMRMRQFWGLGSAGVDREVLRTLEGEGFLS